MIGGLHTYDDIQLFPELFDTAAVIERVTSEADFIEKQLNRSGMYPLPQTQLPCTSGFIPRPNPMFQSITPAAPSPVTGEVAAKPIMHKRTRKSPRQFTTMWTENTHCSNILTNSRTTRQQHYPSGTSANNLQAHMQQKKCGTPATVTVAPTPISKP